MKCIDGSWMKQPYGDDSKIKYEGYNPDTGNRLFTPINDLEFVLVLGALLFL